MSNDLDPEVLNPTLVEMSSEASRAASCDGYGYCVEPVDVRALPSGLAEYSRAGAGGG